MVKSQILEEINRILTEIDKINNVGLQKELLNYMTQHIDYRLWAMEEEMHQFDQDNC